MNELIVQLQEAVYRLNIEGHSHQADAVKQSIAALSSKKLVDAEAVVLSVEDASAILWNLKNDRWDTKSMCALDNAIEQARGKG